MNREQRRRANRSPTKKDKYSKNKILEFERVMKIAKRSVQQHTEPQEFSEGDKVKLNLQAIQLRPNYSKMNEAYKKFVNDNEDTVFTAHFENESSKLISFKEEPRWLFWCGDLLKVEETESDEESDETSEENEQESTE